jgi:GcrA cell cycle regulator
MLKPWIIASTGLTQDPSFPISPRETDGTTMAWTETQIADLKRLWTAGRSTSQIGTALGVSKNAVIGKAHRLNLPARTSPIRRSSEPKHPKRALMPRHKPHHHRRLFIQPGPQRHGSPSCLWPMGDPGNADFHFCGDQTVPGRPYCAEHCARAYLPRNRDQSEAA